MAKIALLGYGKMGKTIAKLAEATGDEVVLRIGADNAEELTPEALMAADVAIDFSLPAAAFGNISLCLDAGVAVVSGTTGWLSRFEEAVAHCREQGGAFFYASNFSVGVNLFFALNRHLARLMAEWPAYQPELTEIHHTQKLDAPSGTAISLAEDILAHHARFEGWGLTGDGLSPNQLPITAEREGDVKGTHEIRWASDVDAISIRHEAHTREGFARGALQAAHWLIGKKGVFGMSDMLGL